MINIVSAKEIRALSKNFSFDKENLKQYIDNQINVELSLIMDKIEAAANNGIYYIIWDAAMTHWMAIDEIIRILKRNGYYVGRARGIEDYLIDWKEYKNE